MSDTSKVTLTQPLSHYNTSLSRQGYSIHKNTLTDQELKEIKKCLSVAPKVNTKFAEPIPPFTIYAENSAKIYVPRYWGIELFGPPKVDKLFENAGDDINVTFQSTIRDYQHEIVNPYLEKAKNKSGGIISVGCGKGKTVMALYILSKLQKKTLIIVHKEFLMNQWIERAEQFLPGAKIGIIQGNVINIVGKDIVIGMLQSISMKDYPKGTFDSFGMIIFDECHHLGAEVFSKALLKTGCPYTLGLSATPNRKDGLTKVFLSYLGDYAYKSDKDVDSNVLVRMYHYKNDDPTYCREEILSFTKINMAKMTNNICYHKRRNDFIVKLVPEFITDKRRVLILSERKEQLKYLKESIDELKICTSGYYLGGMKQSALDQSMTCDVMLGTYNMISEGFDCKLLNTLILASPRSDIEQSIGRILRLQPHERTVLPIVVDITDTFSIYNSLTRKRKEYYKKENYDINNFVVDDRLVETKIIPMNHLAITKTNDTNVVQIKENNKKIKVDTKVCMIADD